MHEDTLLQNCILKSANRSFADLGITTKRIQNDQEDSLLVQCPFPSHLLYSDIQEAVAEYFTSKNQQVPSIQCSDMIRAHITQFAGSALKGAKNVIAVGSGKGGVGKSTVSTNLAIALARAGARVGLLDADIYGPSIPDMMGKNTTPELKDDKYVPLHAHGVDTMSIGFLAQENAPLIWRGPMLAKSLLQMMNLCAWEKLDYLFIDLPPGTGDIQLSLVQKIPLAGAVIVTTPQQVATRDAEKAIQMFQKTKVPILGLIENMALHSCSSCGHQEAIFGQGGGEKLCQRFDVPFLGSLPLERGIQESCDRGVPSATDSTNPIAQQFQNIGREMALNLSRQPLNYSDRLPPVVTST